MYRFIFKGTMSSEFDLDMVNIVTVKQGSNNRPEEQIDIYEIPYQNSDLVIHSGKYKPYIQEFEFILRNPALISQINGWLSGRGKLRLENDLDKFGSDGYYMASVVGGWKYDKIAHNTYNFTVKFKVDPFFYHESGQYRKTYTTQPLTLYNFGNIYTEPYIKINGTGNITLSINSQVCTFADVVDYIEIDSALMIAYKDTLNQGSKMIGDFPVFNVEENVISWSGNVSSLEIISRWRELG